MNTDTDYLVPHNKISLALVKLETDTEVRLQLVGKSLQVYLAGISWIDYPDELYDFSPQFAGTKEELSKVDLVEFVFYEESGELDCTAHFGDAKYTAHINLKTKFLVYSKG